MRLFTNAFLCVSKILFVVAVSVQFSYAATETEVPTLTLSDTEITVGDTVTVSWDTDNASSQDWIGLYTDGSSNTSYRDWGYVSSDSGSLTFTINTPGDYEFRYLLNNGYTDVATSETIVVSNQDDDDGDDGSGGDDGDNGSDGGDTGYELTLSDTEITVGDTVTVSWDTDNASSQDWIGLYTDGSSNTSYRDWGYVSSDSGSLTFTINTPGDYEFRYLLNNGYTDVATSETIVVSNQDDDDGDDGSGGDDGDNGSDGGDTGYELTLSDTEITVGDTVTVSWDTDNASSQDWIGLYTDGSSNTSYRDWGYVSSDSGSLTFTINTPGDYEFRYLLNNGYTDVATSETIVVSNQDDDDGDDGSGGDDGDNGSDGGDTGYSLSTNRTNYERGDTAFVSWEAPQGTSIYLDWIGLYKENTADTEYIAYEYIDRLSNTETFTLRNDGTYEFRFFTNNSFNRVAVSDPITVLNDTTSSCTLPTSDITNYPPPTGPIIALGDSLTFGVGASAGEDYVSELEDRLNITIQNKGVPGDSTQDALERLEQDVLSQNPSAVIVFLGGNDEIRRFYEKLSDNFADRSLKDELDELADRVGYDWMNVPLLTRAETFTNLESIITQIQDTGAVTIVVGFDTAIYDENIAPEYAAIADNTGSFYVPDIFDDVFGRPRLMSDLVHPNDAGYDIFADRIQPSIACVLPQ